MDTGSSGGLDVAAFREVVEGLPVAITVVDMQGTLLYFNAHAAKVLDRKPAYLGTDIRRYHQHRASNTKIDGMLEAFAAGSQSRYSYRAHRYGRDLEVTFTPLMSRGRVAGVIQTAVEIAPDGDSTPSP